jgi:hypothetical protein
MFCIRPIGTPPSWFLRKELERELHRKDKALAETAALLVLSKKRARIGGPPVAVETGRAIFDPRGAAEKFLVDLTP